MPLGKIGAGMDVSGGWRAGGGGGRDGRGKGEYSTWVAVGAKELVKM